MNNKTIDELLLNKTSKDVFITSLISNIIVIVNESKKIPTNNEYNYQLLTNHLLYNDIKDCKQSIVNIINNISTYISNDTILSDDVVNNNNIYEYIIDLIDKLLLDSDIYIDQLSNKKSNNKILLVDKDNQLSINEDIMKPQLKYNFNVNNQRNVFFYPNIKIKFNSLDNQIVSNTSNSTGYYKHPYEYELTNLVYLPNQLSIPITIQSVDPIIPIDPIDVIDSLVDLNKCIDELLLANEIAIDLEHHSIRSFQGFTCLIQISTRTKDYIIDPFPLFSELYLLNKVTTNPAIVKVFHGSRNDILWLQRDFSIYIVNCFDTYFAAKMLKLPTLSLAYLIKLFIGIDIDKRHQLSDWRVRPLPESMKAYARCDTHFLLSIYDKLCTEIQSLYQSEGLINILNSSKKLCLTTYHKETYDINGYKNISYLSTYLSNHLDNSSSNYLSNVLIKLYDWRDQVARDSDESPTYILNNRDFIQLAVISDSELTSLLNEVVNGQTDSTVDKIVKSCKNFIPISFYKQIVDILALEINAYISTYQTNKLNNILVNKIDNKLSNNTLFNSSTKREDVITSPIGKLNNTILSLTPSPTNHKNLAVSASASPITIDYVFQKAGWNSVISSNELSNSISTSLSTSLSTNLSINSAINQIATEATIEVPSNLSNPLFSKTDIDILNAVERSYNIPLDSQIDDKIDSYMTEYELLQKLPQSFDEIYRISNSIRKKNKDKKRYKYNENDTDLDAKESDIKTDKSDVKVDSKTDMEVDTGSIITNIVSLDDSIFDPTKGYDESIYLHYANNNISHLNNNNNLTSNSKDINNTLTIAQQLDWIKDSNQAAELKQSHFQEQLAHQDLSTLDINDRGFSNNTHAAIGALPSNSLSSSPIKQVPPSNKNNFKSGSQTSSHGINKNNKPNPYLHNNKRSSK